MHIKYFLVIAQAIRANIASIEKREGLVVGSNNVLMLVHLLVCLK